MHKKPPPIHLLVSFEASARHNSFKKAGVELSITASAISQQIKQLEEHLGISLFHRLTRKIELTEAGVVFQRISQHTLHAYHSGYSAFQQQFSKPTIRLSVVPFVAFELLIPHLQELESLCPEIDLRIETSMSLVDFEQEPIDAAVRFGLGDWPNLHCHVLAPSQASLVAAPKLLQNQPIRTIDDLANHTLIHTRNSENDWHKVAQLSGVKRIPHKNELVFDTYLSAMKAAENGLGVAIGLFPLNNNWIASGRLQPIIPPLDTPYNHYFVYRKNNPKLEQLACVQDWIQQRFNELAATHPPD
ncbi:hypothetical protein A9Q99_21130 [Gammaproteobacteria bacterium 45_16_T64]|nr:hypothetical protein A9Q99_21130 [Gammaproteobacteria bacterium 45_16_T64]